MPEMILPGTYIEVRDEKLIAPGTFATDNVGIVGTASRGRLARADDPTTVYQPANIGAAREVFGEADAFQDPARAPGTAELTLVRAMELAFANGARNIFAARVASPGGAAATATVSGITFTAVAPGSGYNNFNIVITAGDGGTLDLSISKDSLNESWRGLPTTGAELEAVVNGQAVGYDYTNLASSGGGSRLFSCNGAAAVVAPGTQATAGGTGEAAADAAAYGLGLDALMGQDVQIVVLAGQSTAALQTSLRAHVENASSDLMRRERIGVIGSTANVAVGNLTSPAQDEGRVIFVVPGIRIFDAAMNRTVTLPGAYAAAAVAGRIASLDPHISPTNKTINADGLEANYNGSELEQLLLRRAMVLEQKLGAIRIVRGVTTSTNTAWTQITTRRIVDYARNGVRAAANPFIGKLNNDRVRQALKGSINSLLADMVDREMLVSYQLDVSATREQQIRGICQVTMVVQPTFSIDFIRVVMYLE